MYDKLTRSDIKKMEEEIEYRKLVVRPKAVEDVREAAAQGDRSENLCGEEVQQTEQFAYQLS